MSNDKPVDYDSAVIYDSYCTGCGWPVVISCCNGPMAELHPTSDWWAYCSNQACKNHNPGGESSINGPPEWVRRKT